MGKWFSAALLMIACAIPMVAHAQQRECACVHNETNRNINFRYWYRDENNIVRTGDVAPGRNWQLCWSEGLFNAAGWRSEVFVEIDVDLTPAVRMQQFQLQLGASSGGNCATTPPRSHYSIRFEPSNPNFIALAGGSPGAYPPAAAYPVPAYPQAPAAAYPPPPGYPAPPAAAYPAPGDVPYPAVPGQTGATRPPLF